MTLRGGIGYVAGGVAFVLAMMVFAPILLPFIAGFAIAYFLDPVAQWLARHGVSRTIAALVLVGGFLALMVLAVVLLVP
ncbi:MAG: AI-2E family transporter, partial [Alphaproteobacteria bacterium]